MKRFVVLVLGIALVISVGIGTASAASSNLHQGMFGFSVGMGDSVFGADSEFETAGNDVIDLSGRYLITDDLAILAGFGVREDGSDADATYISAMGGVRKYLRTDDFAPFFGGQVKIVKFQDDNAGIDLTTIDFSAVFGAEYFLSKQFSLEGSVGVGFGQISDNNANTDDIYFGTRTVGVRANFYF